ncbi:MAG TPA: hypothetical protein VFG42_02725 [Baekduia sp.]|uniref:hypothetical protein n=1 Tax=Baekduia sp. TaxID=2600305 RepID=UPI002D794150|nr:hypothetical protein [Baekduia sp.]HET6505682.1 hypothetical protein [Baekduia sp.]
MTASLLPELEARLREAARRTQPPPASGPAPRRPRRLAAPRGRRRRAVVLAVALALLLASVAVAAVRHFTRAGDPAPKRYGLGTPFRGPGRPLPGGARLLDVRAPDPDGGLPWGIRLYRTNRHAACWQVGRVLDGRLGVLGADGLLDDDGLFHELPVERDQCRPLDGAGHVFAFQNALALDNGIQARLTCHPRGWVADRQRRTVCPDGSGRLVLYGFLGPLARTVQLTGAGPARVVRVGEEGAFVLALALPDPLRSPDYTLTATYADGTTRPVDDVPPVESVPDPRADRARPPGYVDPLRGLPDPARVRRPLHVTRERWGGNVVYRIAFRAPAATHRYGVQYTLRVDGPASGRACEDRPWHSSGGPLPETVRAGQRLVVAFTPGWQMRWGRGWCPGRYRVTVVLHDRAHAVGSFAFTA